MNLFDITKIAQQSSGQNIITWAKSILTKTPEELNSFGLKDSVINGIKLIASKTSMNQISSIREIAFLIDIPQFLRDQNFDAVKKHASDFVKGKIKEEFVSIDSVKALPAQKPIIQNPVSEIPVVPKENPKIKKSKPKTIETPVEQVVPKDEIKDFNIFEFIDKSDDKNWKNLILSPINSDLNREIVFILKNLSILFELKLINGQYHNTIPNITKEQYLKLLSSLKSQGWSISKSDPESERHLLTDIQRKDSSSHVEVLARSVLEETKGNWMYEIKVPDLLSKNIDKQEEIVECIAFSFIGMTDDKNYPIDDIKNRKRLCKLQATTDKGATVKGWWVRGDPSDFQRFSDMCHTRKIDNKQLSSLVISDFNSGKFYDPKKRSKVDPKLARFEGIIDGDGYNSEEDFIKEAEQQAIVGLVSKEKKKNPDADVSKLKPYPMQLDGIKFLYSRTHAILGDETGVGKTMQAVVAGHLRLKTDTKKSGKDMKAVVLTKSGVVPQYKRDISNFTGISESEIWTGEELFNYLIQFDHPTKILDQNGNPRIPIPQWKWCILNYEKFAIPPQTNIIRNTITRKQNILDAYLSIMNKASEYAIEYSKNIYNLILQNAKGKKINSLSYKFVKNIVLDYISSNNITNLPSVYLNGRDSSWYNEKELSNNLDGIARSTAFNLVQVALVNVKDIKSLEDLFQKIYRNIQSAKEDKTQSIQKFIERQQLRLQKTSELDDILYRLQDEDISPEEKRELLEEKRLLESIKGKSRGGLNWGENGKRNILTAYFTALSKLGVLNLVVLDEVHTVKNGNPDDKAENFDDEHDANFTTFNTQIVTNGASNVWGASATIVANREQDLYNQLRAVNSPLGDMDYLDFVNQISSTLSSGKEKGISRGLAIRDALVQSRIYLQRSKSDIVAQDPDRPPLPPQNSHTVKVSDPSLIENFHNIQREEIKAAILRGSALGKNRNLVIYNINRESLAKSKTDFTISLAVQHLRQGNRVGIFTDDIDSGKLIKQGLINALRSFPSSSIFSNKSVYFLYGEEDPYDRLIEVDAFMRDPEHSPYAAIVVTFKAGGTGLSMENSANTVIFNDLPQTPVLDTQAKGRFYRINSREANNVYYTVMDVEEDESLYDVLMQKIAIADEISKLNAQDLEQVMRGNARSDFRLRLLAEIAAKEAEYKALEAAERDIKRSQANKHAPKNAKVNFASWYKFANMLSRTS